MRRVTATALFIFISSAPLITATLVVACTIAAIFIVGGPEALFLIQSKELFAWVAGGVFITVFSIVVGYMLLTYHRRGILFAKAYFALCAAGCAYEVVFPSLPSSRLLLSSGLAVELPQYVTHLYMAFMAAFFGLYAWLYKLYSHKDFVVIYLAISGNIALIFDHLYGRSAPQSAIHQRQV